LQQLQLWHPSVHLLSRPPLEPHQLLELLLLLQEVVLLDS
jgi:hypothetical protein